MSAAGGAGPGVGDAAFLALINAHRATSGYSALPDLDAVRASYMASPKDGMGERWLEHERRKSDAAVAVARAAAPGPDRGEAERLTIREAQYRDRCTDLEREVAAAEARAERAERGLVSDGFWLAPDEPSDVMLDAANGATATWRDIKGSALTVNREKMRLRWRAMRAAQLGGPAHGRGSDDESTAPQINAANGLSPKTGEEVTAPTHAGNASVADPAAAGRAAVRRAALLEAAAALDAYHDAIVAPAYRGQPSLHGDIVRALDHKEQP